MYTPGCCDFQVLPVEGSIICGRSMEFPIHVNSHFNVKTRGDVRTSPAPGDTAGLEWQSKYGYVEVIGLGFDDPLEGMNEMGLSFSFLSLESQYQTVAPSEMKQALGIKELGAWILGNFATVEEVKDAIKDVKVWGNLIDPVTQKTMGLHAALHDALGYNLVIEFRNGKVKCHDNPIGVLTNDPKFSWHQDNLRRFNPLSAGTSTDTVINGETIRSYMGSDCMIGMPGEWSSSARFVKIAVTIRVAKKVETAVEGMNLAFHILNTVDRPIGTATLKIGENELYETTLWAVVKDLSHRVFYYRTYDDQSLRSIDLTKLDFAKGKFKSIPLNTGKPTVIDMTETLLI